MTFLLFLFSPFGRISRSSWWTIQLINSAIMIAIIFITLGPLVADPDGAIEGFLSAPSASLVMIKTAMAPMLWIALCATIKRYHDRGKSGVWSALALVPVIGPIWQLIELGSLPGTNGANAFGDPPAGFGAAGAAPNKNSSADSMVWSRNMDDAIAEAAKNLSDQNSAPKQKQTPAARSGARPSFGQRGVS